MAVARNSYGVKVARKVASPNRDERPPAITPRVNGPVLMERIVFMVVAVKVVSKRHHDRVGKFGKHHHDHLG